MADPLHGTPAIGAAGGFAARTPDRRPTRSTPHDQGKHRSDDQVRVATSDAVVLRLLRERVLARTRALFELAADDVGGHEFAEVLENEPAAAFLGRLLSAQNQLAARRAGQWRVERIRAAVDRGLREGAQETLDLLAGDPRHAEGITQVAAVIAEYARRLAAHAASIDSRSV